MRLDQFFEFLESQSHTLETEDVTRFDVLDYLSMLKVTGRKPATVTAFFTWVVKWEMLDKSPTEHIDAPKVPKERKPFLDEAGFDCGAGAED